MLALAMVLWQLPGVLSGPGRPGTATGGGWALYLADQLGLLLMGNYWVPFAWGMVAVVLVLLAALLRFGIKAAL
eukprot:1192646-Lingulodinium_polyedra.AAC.1